MNSARCEKACEYRCRFDDTVGAIWLIMASEENDDTDGSSTEPPVTYEDAHKSREGSRLHQSAEGATVAASTIDGFFNSAEARESRLCRAMSGSLGR